MKLNALYAPLCMNYSTIICKEVYSILESLQAVSSQILPSRQHFKIHQLPDNPYDTSYNKNHWKLFTLFSLLLMQTKNVAIRCKQLFTSQSLLFNRINIWRGICQPGEHAQLNFKKWRKISIKDNFMKLILTDSYFSRIVHMNYERWPFQHAQQKQSSAFLFMWNCIFLAFHSQGCIICGMFKTWITEQFYQKSQLSHRFIDDFLEKWLQCNLWVNVPKQSKDVYTIIRRVGTPLILQKSL